MLVLLQEGPGLLVWPAFVLMTDGLWLHLTEQHNHLHTHELQQPRHANVHDEHHQHPHDFPWDGSEPNPTPMHCSRTVIRIIPTFTIVMNISRTGR